jgi:hypothetical protein
MYYQIVVLKIGYPNEGQIEEKMLHYEFLSTLIDMNANFTFF